MEDLNKHLAWDHMLKENFRSDDRVERSRRLKDEEQMQREAAAPWEAFRGRRLVYLSSDVEEALGEYNRALDVYAALGSSNSTVGDPKLSEAVALTSKVLERALSSSSPARALTAGEAASVEDALPSVRAFAAASLDPLRFEGLPLRSRVSA